MSGKKMFDSYQFQRSSIIAALALLMCSVTGLIADDTDIYLGENGRGGPHKRPNVLFVLDTSGSMRNEDGTGVTRLNRVKAALNTVLDQVDNMNIGLMQFNVGRGGAVTFPVTALDEPQAHGDPDIRTQLKNYVNAIEHTSNTPLVDTYLEAAHYMRGDNVWWGRSRANEYYNVSRRTDALATTNNRISHADSFTGGTIFREGNCNENNLSHPDCVTEFIQGDPKYISPITNICGGNYIVLLTDGRANTPNSTDASDPNSVQQQFNVDCSTESVVVTHGDEDSSNDTERSPSNGERCGPSIAEFLATQDQSSSVPDINAVKTYTIGFNLENSPEAVDYLKTVARLGDGSFFPASASGELADIILNGILGDIIITEGSYTAPSVPVDAFNRLFNRPVVYMNVFETGPHRNWIGNIKKFGLCTNPGLGCSAGELVVDGDTPATDASGRLRDDVADDFDRGGASSARAVDEGGLGALIGDWDARRIYTLIGATPSQNSDNNPVTAGDNLTRVDASADVIVPGNSQTPLRLMLHGDYGHCNDASDGSVDDVCMNELVQFLHGKRTGQHQRPRGDDSDSTRWGLADTLHGQVLDITYGQASGSGDPVSKLIFGTNDGGLHVHDATTGAEHFTIYPKEILAQLEAFQANEKSSSHLYGLDVTPSVRMRDANGDGIIDPSDGDFVHVYVAMRRGGRGVYAFNLTPDRVLTDHSAANLTPTLMWAAYGSANDSKTFRRLGQTWSRPLPVELFTTNGVRTALVFGGGYDPSADDAPGRFGEKSDIGNAIYIVDALSGEPLWWASSDYQSGTDEGTPGMYLPDMTAGVAADLQAIDSDSDGFIDRLYAADTAGQVWRVDIAADIADTTAARLAKLGSSTADNRDERKFFYAPNYAQVTDTQFSGVDADVRDYDIVTVVSGNRPNPLNIDTHDRVYALRDYLTDDTIRVSGADNTPVNFPRCAVSACNRPLNHTDLVDVTTTLIPTTVPAGPVPGIVASLRTSYGWYSDLSASSTEGEKGFSEVTIVDGGIYFTSFAPVAEADEPILSLADCEPKLGTAYLYGMSIFTGAPMNAQWDGNSGDLTLKDRAFSIGNGPSSQPILVTGTDDRGLYVQTSPGAQLASDFEQPGFVRTFWYQE